MYSVNLVDNRRSTIDSGRETKSRETEVINQWNKSCTLPQNEAMLHTFKNMWDELICVMLKMAKQNKKNDLTSSSSGDDTSLTDESEDNVSSNELENSFNIVLSDTPKAQENRDEDTLLDTGTVATGKDAYFSANYWKIPDELLETAGKGVLVAVLDTGINPDHSIFQEGQTAVYTKNFVDAGQDCETLPAFDQDPKCHGTAVASIIAGRKIPTPFSFRKEFNYHDKPFVVGVAPKASLVICRVSVQGSVGPEWVNKALKWIVDHNNVVLKPSEMDKKSYDKMKKEHMDGHDGCKLDHSDHTAKIPIVNMSFTFKKENHTMEKLILDLKEQNVLCVASCGNDYGNYDPGYPALYGNVLSVGATDHRSMKCDFTTVPRTELDIDVYALGKDVVVAKTSEAYIKQKVAEKKKLASATGQMPPLFLPTSSVSAIGDKKGKFETESGTSFAAPAVCGLIAIILQHARSKDTQDEQHARSENSQDEQHARTKDSQDEQNKHNCADAVTNITTFKKLIKFMIDENYDGALKKVLRPQSVHRFLCNIKSIDAYTKFVDEHD